MTMTVKAVELSVYTLSNVKEERVEREQVGRIDDEYARH
jgi:hypothetical protein